MKRIIFLAPLLLFILNSSYTQVLNPVKWEFTSRKLSENNFELRFTANIDRGWHMYGLNLPDGGPLPTKFIFENEERIVFLTELNPLQKPEVKFDSTFEMMVELFDTKAGFVRKVKVARGKSLEIKGMITFMACDDSRCLPPKDTNFTFSLKPPTIEAGEPLTREKNIVEIAESEVPKTKEGEVAGNQPEEENLSIKNEINSEADKLVLVQESSSNSSGEEKMSIWEIIIRALIGGFIAVLTPCVYPIIPLTVSYFMRDNSRSKTIFSGILFGVSIVLIYTSVGLISGLTRFDLVFWIKSQWLPNLFFFILFVLLAFSFFGLFEIVLPGRIANKIDQQADKGGLLGPFFMALATVIVSFSCVGPIAGIILGNALRGDILTPVIGMFAFSLTFALPFTLLAIFPAFMKKIPKSGGWLNTIKVFFAFVLLAFSLVFLSNIGLKFITRDVVLVIAIVIFALLGFYLLGKIKFAHDSEISHVSIPRLVLAIVSFSFAIYMVPGLFGAPLKSISPFLPSREEMSFDLTRNINGPAIKVLNNDDKTICSSTPKYSDFLHMPLGLKGYFDYDEALTCAKKLNKPVLIDFAGHGCKNCKKMYAEVWSDPRVLQKLKDEFVVVALYTDDRTDLPENDWITSIIDGKVKNTVGKKFNNLQIEKFGTNTLPLYAIVNSDGVILTDRKYYEYSPDIESFISFLDNGLLNFKE